MSKLRKTRQKLALSLTPLGAVRAAAVDWVKKIDVWENPMVYAKTRGWYSLFGTMRSGSETAAQPSCSHFQCPWEHSGCLSSACSEFYCDASGEFCLTSL